MALDGVAPKKLSLNLQPPAPFDFVHPGTWPAWLSRYEDYAVVSGLTQASGDMQSTPASYTSTPYEIRSSPLAATTTISGLRPRGKQSAPASCQHVNSAAARHIHVLTALLETPCATSAKRKDTAEVCRVRQAKQKLGSIQLHAVGTPAAAKFVDITVDNYTAQFKVDSGAEVSAVPSDFPALPAKLDPVNSLLTGPGGQPPRVLGSYMARLPWHGKMSSQRLYVIQSLTVPLLGLPALQALEVVKFLDELQTTKATLRAELFQELGTLKDEYTTLLRPDAVPFSLSVPRRIPIPLREVVRHELDKLEEGGVIRRVDNPTPWCSGLVVVRKADGSYRLCVDLTQLNKVVLRERHILPTVEQVLDLLGLLGDASFLQAGCNSQFSSG
nr:uncharacterized protein LOC119181893 [Rhipicephalus microplus]